MPDAVPIDQYAFKDGCWYWHGRECKGADNATFVPHNNVWATDKKGLFKQDTRVRLHDPATCQVLNLLFAKDGQQVYYIEGTAKAVADVASFEVLDPGCYTQSDGFVRRFGFARDSVNVYSHDFFSGAPKVLKGATRNTFRRLDYGYGADDKSVWNDSFRIKKADPNSFVILNDAYSKDHQHAFCGDTLIAGADNKSFEVVGPRTAIDAQHVFYGGQPIPGADPNSFGIDPDGSFFSRDATHVFYADSLVPGADPDTFVQIGDTSYYRDKHTIYYLDTPVAGVDADSFEAIRTFLGKDKFREYNSGKPVQK